LSERDFLDVVHYWQRSTILSEVELTKEQRDGLRDIDVQLVGHGLPNGRSEKRELVPGIPVPSWFNPQMPTLSEVNQIGMRTRR
jgi:hypothetical protein